MEEWGAGESEGAPRTASSFPEPTPTYRGSELPPPWRYAPPPVQRGPRSVTGYSAGDVAELVGHVKWAGRTRGGQEKRGTHPFSDLVSRAARPRERGPEMEEGRWRRMLGEALQAMSQDCPQEQEENPRVQKLREMLQTEGCYEGDA